MQFPAMNLRYIVTETSRFVTAVSVIVVTVAANSSFVAGFISAGLNRASGGGNF